MWVRQSKSQKLWFRGCIVMSPLGVWKRRKTPNTDDDVLPQSSLWPPFTHGFPMTCNIKKNSPQTDYRPSARRTDCLRTWTYCWLLFSQGWMDCLAEVVVQQIGGALTICVFTWFSHSRRNHHTTELNDSRVRTGRGSKHFLFYCIFFRRIHFSRNTQNVFFDDRSLSLRCVQNANW